MSKSVRPLLIMSAAVLFILTLVWLHYAFLYDDPAFAFNVELMTAISIVPAIPFAVVGVAKGVAALHWHLRKPDFVIRVSTTPAPLLAKFHEQERRLERREQLRGELFKLNGQIETFAAGLSPDERKAWQDRPGPYGK